MTTAFDLGLDMGDLSGKSLEGAPMDDYDFVNVDHYGGPQTDASSPTQVNTKPADGDGAPLGHGYDGSTKSKKHDGAIFESRKGLETILLFTGLFSATVSLFIIESYKNSSPDPGEQTVALLKVSKRLMEMSRSTPLGLSPSPDSMSFSPPAVRASIMWFLSLGLNIICAIWAILWERYIDPLGLRAEPHNRAPGVRAFLFSGVGRFGMEPTVETIWVLLHASVLFFFIGLVDFLLQINNTVACVFLGCIVPLVLVYIATTLLLSNSHYFTPSSSGSWKGT